MESLFNELTSYSDIELLSCCAMFLGGLFICKVCEWVVQSMKWLHDWLSSMFPTSIDRK